MSIPYTAERRFAIPMSACVAVVGVFVALTTAVPAQGPECRDTSNIPLTDLTRSYRGLEFGLYPGRRTSIPDDHLARGRERANRIRPLDVTGKPSANGKIVLMSVGMSNTSSEFARFVTDVKGNPAINRRVAIRNGSLSGADAAMWTDPDSPPWQNAIAAATGRDSSVNQVQVVWVKQAHLRTAPFPQEVELLEASLGRVLRIAKAVFPNLQIAYLSSRTRSGAETRQGPGEPQAYETAFAVRRLIAGQIESRDRLAADAAWLSWGPYLWSSGTSRSDGFVWDCADLRRDLLHPSDSGSRKVSEQLMAFFMTEDTATPWFLEPSRGARGPAVRRVSASTTQGSVPLTVDFSVDAPGATRHFWSFADGTSSLASNPQKTFYVSGLYTVRLTVTDDTGNWARSSVVIRAETGR